jgi:beta-phosphoglucomutase-like phosphatase (HAD superfamily)
VTRRRLLLCDADGNLFPSEEPAFAASAVVTNRLLRSRRVEKRYTPDELQAFGLGRTFRTNAAALLEAHGETIAGDELERWVGEENAAVAQHLAQVLRPDVAVLAPLQRLAGEFELAAVSSSGLRRLDACFRAAGLAELFPPGRRFSAEDSLPAPRSKPAPDVYLQALVELEATPDEAVAVEDSVAGVTAANAAGIRTIGNLVFTPEKERRARAAALVRAGAELIVHDWTQLANRLEREVGSSRVAT